MNSTTFTSVEFMGGPRDGLRIVKGVGGYTCNPSLFYALEGDSKRGHFYRPREVVNGVLKLDHVLRKAVKK